MTTSINEDLKQFEKTYFSVVQQMLKLADKVGLDVFRLACEEVIEIKQVEKEQGVKI